MSTEQVQSLEILQMAIQMEIDGKAFYEKAAKEALHEMGKKLFTMLAAEEDNHRRTFEKIYETLRNQKSWPVMEYDWDKGQAIKTIFAQAAKDTGKTTASEIEAVKKAIDMETQSYDLYSGQAKTAASSAAKSFYEDLAAEERGHHLALIEYLEFLKDPAGYYLTKEHHSLDGG